MISVNKETILNSSLQKRLIRGYHSLKENYTKENAFSYNELYKDAKLSEILENSEFIFKEPYYGYNFYKNIMENVKIPPHRYQEELEKVESYMESYSESMSEDQKSVYEALVSIINEKGNDSYNKSLIEGYSIDHKLISEDTVNDLYDNLYLGNLESSEDILESMTECEPILLYGLDCFLESSPGILYKKIKDSIVCEDAVESVEVISRAINTMQLLSQDYEIMESVDRLDNANLSLFIKGLSRENQNEYIEEYTTEKCESFDPIYASPQLSVNRIFDDEMYSESMKDIYAEEKVERYNKVKAIYETAFDFIMEQYLQSNSPEDEICKSYLVEENTTLQDAVHIIGSKIDELDNYISEFTNHGEATPVVKRSGTDLREEPDDSKKKKSNSYHDDEEEPSDEDDETYNAKKKPVKPSQSMSSKLQQKGLDADVQFNKKLGEGQRKGQVIKNTLKAVTKVPQSIINTFKRQIKHWDDMDDNRRKEYIIKPGNRKKIFSSFKLALYYYLPLSLTGGGVAGTILKAKLLPVLFVCRHFSKDKNKRIRNELAAELDTEIKVCEEKIQDAGSNGDQKAKYQLMRIKDKLVAERTRVRANSKYI